ncbi:MAG: WxL domain-containing protein [Lactobacillales bacterium]|nr:WxL domain-containing protein [Lactobacillales bacterium]
MGATLLAPALLASVPASALEDNQASSDATVRFTQNTKNIIPIVPGTEDEPVLVPGGTPNAFGGGVRLLAVPSFDFLVHEISSRTETYPALKELVVRHDAAGQTGDFHGLDNFLTPGGSFESDSAFATLNAIPHFAQVANFSGNDSTTWELKAALDAPFTTTDGKTLAATNINLDSAVITNNQNVALSNFSALGAANTVKLYAPNKDGKLPVTILTSNGLADNGTITSVVFDSSYNEGTDVNVADVTAHNNYGNVIGGWIDYTSGVDGVDILTPLIESLYKGDQTAIENYAAIGQKLNGVIYGAKVPHSLYNDVTTPDDDSTTTVNQEGVITNGAGANSVIGSIREAATATAGEAKYINNAVTLTVPYTDRALAQRYSTSITWTLSFTVRPGV